MCEFPRSLFPSGFPTKVLYEFNHLPLHSICPIHAFLLEFITFGQEVIIMQFYTSCRHFVSVMCKYSRYPFTVKQPNVVTGPTLFHSMTLYIRHEIMYAFHTWLRTYLWGSINTNCGMTGNSVANFERNATSRVSTFQTLCNIFRQMKSSRAIGRVCWLTIIDVSGSISVPIIKV
jgi:hypothetical protein